MPSIYSDRKLTSCENCAFPTCSGSVHGCAGISPRSAGLRSSRLCICSAGGVCRDCTQRLPLQTLTCPRRECTILY